MLIWLEIHAFLNIVPYHFLSKLSSKASNSSQSYFGMLDIFKTDIIFLFLYSYIYIFLYSYSYHKILHKVINFYSIAQM